MLTNGMIQNEKFLEANHLRIDRLSKCISSQEKSYQVCNMLGKKVEDNSVDKAPEYAPNFTESEGNGNQDAIGRHHQYCA